MSRSCIVVANAYRARIFTVDPTTDDWGVRSLRLTERGDLVQPGARLRDADVFTTTESGARRRSGVASARSQPLDDHRRAHDEVEQHRFAEAIVVALRSIPEIDRWHVIAGPPFLGRLRRALGAAPRGVQIAEHARDLSGLDAHALRLRLIDDGVLPA